VKKHPKVEHHIGAMFAKSNLVESVKLIVGGENNPRAKIKESDVKEIREYALQNGVKKTREVFSEKLGLSPGYINQIIRKRTWKNV